MFAIVGTEQYEQMLLLAQDPDHLREIRICNMRFELAQIRRENPKAIMPPSAAFLVDLETLHPELTWNFETGEIEAAGVSGYPIIIYKSETLPNGYTKLYPTFKETGERVPF